MHSLFLRVGLLTLFFAAAATAVSRGAEDDAGPVQVTLSPMPAPNLPLQLRLWPNFADRVPGNAAVYYGKIKSEQNHLFNNRELLDNVEAWRDQPLEELAGSDAVVPGFMNFDNSPAYYLRQGALCTHCDWQLPIGREPFFTILLPELQESRQYARFMTSAARIHLSHGRFAEAVETLQINYALGRHVAQSETIVGGLVGIAISSVGNKQLLDFIQQPEAPNMYWALAELPHPLVDLRTSVRAETAVLELTIPGLRTCVTDELTAEEARRLYFDMWDFLTSIRHNVPRDRAAATLVGAAFYPDAKSRLIAHGLAPERVETMPVAQVLTADAYVSYRRRGDLAAAAFALPYPAAMKTAAALEQAAARDSAEDNMLLSLMDATQVWMAGVRSAQVRLERELAVLRLLEAVRMHAAAHDGRLPRTLADIEVAPVPNDPVTEAPFQWQVNEGVAELTGPPLRDNRLHYQIRMRAATASR